MAYDELINTHLTAATYTWHLKLLRFMDTETRGTCKVHSTSSTLTAREVGAHACTIIWLHLVPV